MLSFEKQSGTSGRQPVAGIAKDGSLLIRNGHGDSRYCVRIYPNGNIHSNIQWSTMVDIVTTFIYEGEDLVIHF